MRMANRAAHVALLALRQADLYSDLISDDVLAELMERIDREVEGFLRCGGEAEASRRRI